MTAKDDTTREPEHEAEEQTVAHTGKKAPEPDSPQTEYLELGTPDSAEQPTIMREGGQEPDESSTSAAPPGLPESGTVPADAGGDESGVDATVPRRPDTSEQPEVPTIMEDVQETVQKTWAGVAGDANTIERTLKADMPGRSGEPTLVGPEAEARKQEAGGVLGEFTVLEMIGEGGVGVVYAARQASLDREVALKVLKDVGGKGRKAMESSFTTEAIVTGDLDHPNIVPVYTLGEDSQGRTFYTMKKVSGVSWQKKIDEMSLEENIEVLLRVCDALAFSHAKGVIHRDLKPDNVMLGDYGEVLVMDWGLAAPVRPESKFEKHGGAIPFGGTPAYMAPEMALDQRERVKEWSDIYLLGGILYRIVTGLAPHAGKSCVLCLSAAAENQIQKTDRRGELVDIAMQAMATRPEDRHQDVRAFQEAIRRYKAHAQSIQLVQEARGLLEAAIQAGDYDRYARAIFGFETALSLWEGNDNARRGRDEARLAYAQAAYENEDFDLALSLLDESVPEHLALKEVIQSAKAERIRRLRHLRSLKIGATALAVLFVASLTVGFFWIRAERDKALREGYATKIGLAAKKIEDLRFDKAEEMLDSCPSWLRHWEWGRLKYVCNRALVTFRGHSRQLEAVAFSPDGTIVASGSWQGIIKVWAAGTGKELFTLEGHKDDTVVCRLAFSPDGALLASAGDDGTVRLWDVKGAREVAKLEGHTGEVWAVAFSPDGRTVVSGGKDSTVRQWSVKSRSEILTLKGDWGPVACVAFSLDGRLLAWAGGELGEAGQINIRDMTSGMNLGVLTGHADRVNYVALSSDGKTIASSSWDKTVRLWDLASGKCQAVLRGHRGEVNCVAFSPDGTWVASAGADNTIIRWDTRRRRPVAVFKGHSDAIGGIAVSSDGSRIVSASTDGTAKVWDVGRRSAMARVLTGHKGSVSSVAFSPDGKLVASGSEDGKWKLWDPASGAEVRSVSAGHGAVCAVAFSPNGKRLASGNGDGTVTLWEVATGESVRTLEGHSELVRSVKFSPDGRWLATVSFDGALNMWDVSSGKKVAAVKGHSGPVQDVAFSPDGSALATAGRDCVVGLWDVEERRMKAKLKGHTHWVRAVAFSPDGELLASGGDDNLVKLWSAKDGTEIASLKGHTNYVKSVAFSPDGRRLISGGDDAVVRVWDLETGRELIALKGHLRFIWSVAFSPDGRRVASGSGDQTVRIWDAWEWEE